MKKGVQLYSIRAVTAGGMDAALKAVSDIGYEGVEFAGFCGMTAEETSSLLQKYNLEVLGAHVAEELIFDKTEETIAYHKAIGNDRIILPWSNLKTRADVLALAEKLTNVMPKFEAAGQRLYYHNHNHEFVKDGGEYLLDILAAEVPELWLELDLYWVYRGGESPAEYVEKYKNRLDLFHAKDGIGERSTPLGEGEASVKAVIDLAKTLNVEWIVAETEISEVADEQLGAIKKDYKNLLELL